MSYDVNLKCRCCNTHLFESNHTSNTAGMWNRHNFYLEDWHNKLAFELHEELINILDIMVNNGNKFYERYVVCNEWGTYDSTCQWFIAIKEGCIDYPNAIVEVSN